MDSVYDYCLPKEEISVDFIDFVIGVLFGNIFIQLFLYFMTCCKPFLRFFEITGKVFTFFLAKPTFAIKVHVKQN